MNAAWEQPDAVLIQRWQQGETAAFETLVSRWQQPMARFLARLGGRPERVADLCQEVFLRVLLAGLRYRENGAFSTWLYRIALNVARDEARRQRHAAVPLAEVEPYTREMPAAAACEQRELAEAVSAALAALPAPWREVLVLR